MKKVLSFVLVLTLVLGSFSMAFAATTTPKDVVDTDWEEAVAALTELGVVNGYTDGTYQPTKSVNRAEAAKLVIAALGLTSYAEKYTGSTFTDLEGYAWATGYIGYAQALGVLQGVGNGLYNPAGEVTYEQIATMLVRAIGYTDASLPGTWPANYLVKAKALGIMKNINAAGSTAANRGDVAVMIFNNLENEIGYIDKDNVWQFNIPVETMMTRLDREEYPISTTAQAIAGVDNSFLVTTEYLDEVADGFNLTPYLGQVVVAYRNTDTDNEICGIKSVETTSLTVDNFSKNSIVLADGTEYKMDKLGVTKDNYNTTATVGAVHFTNMEDVAPAYVTTIGGLVDATLAVTLSGNYVKAIYSISDWNAEEPVQWDADLAEELADDDTLDGNAFYMTNKDKIDTEKFTLVGADSLDKIPTDAVVTAYLADLYDGNNYVVRVEVSTATVTGEVTKTNADGDKFYINGTGYKKVGGDESLDDVALSANGTYYLDYNGKIAFADVEIAKANNYAIVTKSGAAETGYDNNMYKIKLFTAADAKEVVYVIDDDTEGLTAAAVAANPNELVGYDLNKAGEVTTMVAIDPYNTVNNNVKRASTYTSKGLMDGLKLASDVVVFTYDGKDWSLGEVKNIPGTDDLNNDVYYLYDADLGKIVVVMIGENAAPTENEYAIVTGYSKVKNADDKTVYEVTYFMDGAEMTCLTDALTQYATENVLSKVTFTDGELTAATAVTVAATNNALVKSVADEGIKVSGAGFTIATFTSGSYAESAAYADGAIVDVADDVVVYYLNEDGDMAVSNLKSIKKDYHVTMFQMDEDDDQVDIIIYTK